MRSQHDRFRQLLRNLRIKHEKEMEVTTTKAALCPKCNQFHLIASIEGFNESKEVQKDFIKLLKDGFQIVEVTTKEAKERFGYCADDEPIPKPTQTKMIFKP